MRSVRCDACGAKAMTAAAKCPTCSHLLDLRDGFGELLPLAYCSSCDSYYPEQLGECKWCHTKPDRPPIDAKIWRGVGAGVAAVLGAVWLIGNLTSSDPKRPRSRPSASNVARKQVSDTSVDTTRVDTTKQVVPTTVVASANEDSAASVTPVAPPAPIVLPQGVTATPNPAMEPAVTQPVAAMPRAVQSNGNVSPASRRTSSRWVRSVS